MHRAVASVFGIPLRIEYFSYQDLTLTATVKVNLPAHLISLLTLAAHHSSLINAGCLMSNYLPSPLDATQRGGLIMPRNSKDYRLSVCLLSLLSLSLSFAAAFYCPRSITHLPLSEQDAAKSRAITQESDETLASLDTSSNKRRVIVIGAGVGGLASAARIAAETRNWDEDVEVVVVEKNAREMIG